MYLYNNQITSLEISFGLGLGFEYGFEFQGALETSHMTVHSERCLHWLACGVKMAEFGFALSKNVSCCIT